MRWEVTGSDSITGVERAITVEAANKEAAQVEANFKGVLVKDIHPVAAAAAVREPVVHRDAEHGVDPDGITIDDASAEAEGDEEYDDVDAGAPPAPRPKKKWYLETAKHAHSLDVVASIFSGLGYALLLVAILDFAAMLLAVATQWARRDQLPSHFAFVGLAVLGCFLIQGMAAALRMFASIGMAVHEMAREARRARKLRLAAQRELS